MPGPERADVAAVPAAAPTLDAWWDDAAFRAALAAPLGLEAVDWPGVGTVYRRRRLGLAQLELAPLGLYAPRSASLEDFIEQAPRRAARVSLHLDPLDDRREALAALAARAAAGGWQVLWHESHLLALDRPLEELRRGYHATKRSQVRRASALPCEIECTRERGRLDEYFALYAASAARWGRAGPPYPRALFEALLASPTVELWLLRVGGRPCCAMVVFVGRGSALYWQGVSDIDETQKAAFPMLRLMDALIGSLVARGVPWLNLGASEGLPSVRRFKEELGARAVAYPTLRHESAAWRTLAALRRVASGAGRAG